MAVQRRINILSQQRVDSVDIKSIESAASNDFDQLFQAFVTGTSQGYFLRGFNILMAGAINGAASGLQLNVDPGALLHTSSSVSGTVFQVPAGTPVQQLNSATNTIVDGAFVPSATNYVSIEYERFIDNTTSAQVYLWDPTTKSETTKNSPRAQILRFRVKITTAAPLTNYLPIATVVTDASNNVVSITDDRWSLFRLGQGGTTPNPFYTYPWSQGRTENSVTATSSGVDPFSGGDKNIDNLKSWMDTVMSSLQEIKGTTYWYSLSSSGSLETLREDLGNTIITGKGFIAHGVATSDKTTATQAGQINWNQDVNIRVIGSALTYKISANPSTGPGNGTDIVLTDDRAAYVSLVRGVVVSPNLIFSNGVAQVSSVGSISWTSSLLAGDYLKLGSDTDAGYYQILSVDSLTQVTLTIPYAGTSTGASGAKGKYAFGSYQTSPSPSTSRHIRVANRASVPAGQDVFWLFVRSDNGGAQPRVYIRFLGTELDQGENRDVSDTTSSELLGYIGSASESTYKPLYVSSLTPGSVPQLTAITIGDGSTITGGQYFLLNSSGDFRKYYVWFKVSGSGTDPIPANTSGGIEVDILSGDSSSQVASTLAAALQASPFGDFSPTSGSGTVAVTYTSSGTVTSPFGQYYVFTVTSANASLGDTYVNNGKTFTVVSAIAAGTILVTTGTGAPLGSGTLTKATGSGDTTITFSANAAPFFVASTQAGTGTGNYSIHDGDNLTFAIKEVDKAIGLIKALMEEPSYSEMVSIVVSGATPPTSLNAPVTSGTLITLPNNSRLGNIQQKYVVGEGTLEVFLNGQYLTIGDAYLEVGPDEALSNQIQILFDLVAGDELTFRVDINGGSGGLQGPAGPQGPQGAPGLNGTDPVNISPKTSNYTLLATDDTILVDCSTGPVTITLPPAAGINITGRRFTVKKIDSTGNAMTLKGNGAENIDGVNTQPTSTQWFSFTAISNGTAWFLI
jgi:hypothetical protein